MSLPHLIMYKTFNFVTDKGYKPSELVLSEEGLFLLKRALGFTNLIRVPSTFAGMKIVVEKDHEYLASVR